MSSFFYKGQEKHLVDKKYKFLQLDIMQYIVDLFFYPCTN